MRLEFIRLSNRFDLFGQVWNNLSFYVSAYLSELETTLCIREGAIPLHRQKKYTAAVTVSFPPPFSRQFPIYHPFLPAMLYIPAILVPQVASSMQVVDAHFLCALSHQCAMSLRSSGSWSRHRIRAGHLRYFLIFYYWKNLKIPKVLSSARELDHGHGHVDGSVLLFCMLLSMARL